ncbi:MAG: MBOAT family protein [Candidatus Krumholzibacteriia bacterium]
MLFNSLEFLLFFPAVVALYFGMPPRFRWVLLLAASYYFYASWRVEYLSLIIISTVVDYVAGLGLGAATSRKLRRLWLGLSLTTNLGLLFAFKYYGFFSDSLAALSGSLGRDVMFPELQILLPVGISFYTFQTLSYTIDVYNRKRPPERHLGIFAVYVSFFPQLVAGPIERSTSLLPQFRQVHVLEASRVATGLRLILWGFVKKVVIADRLALYVDVVYDDPSSFGGAALITASILFAVQIYCDFSGYSDIAIGTARIMGFDLMTNFRQPYFASSIREFWQRWHISLSTWFRDYVYIPLGGSRNGAVLTYANLLVTFIISGLWHGANWTFVVWGALHGMYLATSNMTSGIRRRFVARTHVDAVPGLLPVWRVFATNVLVLFGWIFFRANSLDDAFLIIGRIAGGPGEGLTALVAALPGSTHRDLAFVAFMIGTLSAYDYALSRDWRILGRPAVVGTTLSLQFWAVLIFGVFSNQQFIYFQF